MRATLVVLLQPGIQIGLQVLNCAIDLFPERDPVKLIQHSPVEALADAVGLIEFLEAIEAVSAIAHDPAGFRHIPQLLGQLQQSRFGLDDLRAGGHGPRSFLP